MNDTARWAVPANPEIVVSHGDVATIRPWGVFTRERANSASRAAAECDCYAVMFDLQACLITPGALGGIDNGIARPAAIVVSEAYRLECEVSCLAAASSGLLQAAFVSEDQALSWALERALARRLADLLSRPKRG